jgi:hypothetical protein
MHELGPMAHAGLGVRQGPGLEPRPVGPGTHNRNVGAQFMAGAVRPASVALEKPRGMKQAAPRVPTGMGRGAAVRIRVTAYASSNRSSGFPSARRR